jgi:hypothetical protein
VAKKVNLPLFVDTGSGSGSRDEERAKPAKKKPSIDSARARLGGRITETDAPTPGFAPGVVVTFSVGSDRRMPGVVVFASQAEVHVLLDGIRLRRLSPDDLLVHEGRDLAIELEKIAGDARLFGQLVEGQAVRYADDAGTLINGKVVEKCRWGALVLRDDGAVVAVGFRKLWPAPAGGSA